MRIQRISIRNFRAIEALDLDLASIGVTIIEGPNETGKTSITDALSLLIDERDDTTKAAVKALRPVGTDAGPEVEAEFTSGPYAFTYRKRWLKNKETVLNITAPKPESLAGRAAHDRVRAILDETMDGSLWSALRLEQNASLEQAPFVGGSLGRALDAAAGGAATGGESDDLWERVCAERDRYWTPTGQAKGDLVAAAKAVGKCAAEVDALLAVLASVEEDVEKVAALEAERVELAIKIETNAANLTTLEERGSTISTLRTEAARLEQQLTLAEAKAEHAEVAGRQRNDLVEGVEAELRNVDSTNDAIASADTAIKAAKESVILAEEELKSARASAEAARTAYVLARDDRDHRHRESELERLAERREIAVAAIGERDRAQAVIDRTRVTEDLLKRIETANSALLVARTRSEHAASTIEVRAEADLTVTINDASRSVRAGESLSEVVTDPLHLGITGLGTVIVTPGSSASELNEGVERALAQLSSLLSDAGTEDIDAARSAYQAFRDARLVVESTAATIAANLRDLTLDEASAKIERLTVRVVEYEAIRTAATPMPASLDAAEDALASAQDAHGTAAKHQAELETALDGRRRTLQGLEDENAAARAAADQATGRLEVEQGRLATARESSSDEAVHDAAIRSRREADDARAAHDAATAALKDADADSFEILRTNAIEAKQGLERRRGEIEISLAGLRARIDAKGDEGLAGALDSAETKLAHAKVDHERLTSRAAAALLLHETFAQRRSEARHRYVAPFRERIESLGRVVFGADFAVELDENLRIISRTLHGRTLDFGKLSTGTKEQLGLISRLACAAIVADDEGAPVIFDDALGWSDPTRLDRMGAVISSAGDNCQVIVLTCTPGRYSSVGKATVLRI